MPAASPRDQYLAQINGLLVALLETGRRRQVEPPLLRRFQVQNFRNIGQARATLGRVNVIIGANGIGKTNLLTALAMIFPESGATEVGRFPSAFGDAPLGGTIANQFLNSDVVGPPSVVGGWTSEGSIGVRAEADHRLFHAHWFGRRRWVAELLADRDLNRARWLPESDTKVRDYRRLSRQYSGPLPRDGWVGQDAQRELAGDARISVDLDPDIRGIALDQFEQALMTMVVRDAGTRELVGAVSRALDLGNVRFNPVLQTTHPILPSAGQHLLQQRQIEQAEALVSLLQSTLHKTGSEGQIALHAARGRLADLVETREFYAGAGLILDHFRPVKALGSGARRALKLGIQVSTSSLCLIDEPELHLHPTMIARLIGMICSPSVQCQVVMTTHSPVVIDEAVRNGGRLFRLDATNGENALTQIDTAGLHLILSNLGWRPAHLLQANAVIWVEGESDAIYVTRWIELWSNGALKPGEDFVCAHFGGNPKSLLSPTTGQIHKMNPHAILLCDSDADDGSPKLSVSKEALIRLVNQAGGYAFATDGREIENYVPLEIFDRLGLRIVGSEAIDLRTADLPRLMGFERQKVAVAKAAARLWQRDHIEADPVLRVRVGTICERIAGWRQIVARAVTANPADASKLRNRATFFNGHDWSAVAARAEIDGLSSFLDFVNDEYSAF